MKQFLVITAILAASVLFILGALYLSRVPLWKRLCRRYPAPLPWPDSYSIHGASVLLYDDSTGYGIKVTLDLIRQADHLFVALQPIGIAWLDRLPPLCLPIAKLVHEGNILRCTEVRIVRRSGGAVFTWENLIGSS